MTDREKLIAEWKREEDCAHIHGWDFSHIAGRYTEETDIPWDYRQIILEHLTDDMRLMDIDTGGGEFLLSLEHHGNQFSRIEERRSGSRRQSSINLDIALLEEVLALYCFKRLIVNFRSRFKFC